MGDIKILRSCVAFAKANGHIDAAVEEDLNELLSGLEERVKTAEDEWFISRLLHEDRPS